MLTVEGQAPAFALQAVLSLKPDRQCIASANDLAVWRNVDEVLRVLDALQAGELCPYDRKAGEPTLQVA